VNAPTTGVSLCLASYEECMTSSLKKMRRKIETKLEDTQWGFRRAHSTTEQISTLQQIYEKSWETAKYVYTCFVDLGKYMAAFLKVWGVLREYRTVLTSASCWLSNNCISVQKIASASTELNHNCSLLVLDSDNGVGACCH